LVDYLGTLVDARTLEPALYEYRSACLSHDSATLEDPCADDGSGVSEAWFWSNPNLIAARLYGLYRYVLATGDWARIEANWDFIKTTMVDGLGADRWDEEAGFFLWEDWIAGRFYPHVQLGAMLAVREMASHVADEPTRAEAATRYDRMAQARVQWGGYVRSLYTDGTLTPQPYDNVESWGYDQAVSPIPIEGFLDATNDYRQVYMLLRDGNGALVARFEEARDVYPYELVGFHPLYPELAALVHDNLLDQASDYAAAMERLNPWWYMGDYGHQVCVGGHEEESFSPVAAADLFQIHARVLGESFAELAPMLPWVYQDLGPRDLLRLQNLVALLDAP
jgi:hypothetical protein